MKKFFGAFAILMATLFLALNANASILIEPHVGYNIKGGQAAWGNYKEEYSGAQYGARLGGQFLGVMGGLAYNHASYTMTQTPLVVGTKSDIDASQNDLGVFVGYNAPILIRAWIGYYLSSKVTLTTSKDEYKGKVTEIGVGFTPLPLLSLNVMYRMGTYDEKYTSSTGLTATQSPNYEPKEIVIGVSLPLNVL